MSDPTCPRVLNRRTHGIPDGAVYVGRPTKWGNPFKLGREGDRDEVIRKYRTLVTSDSHAAELLRARARDELRGKDLVCWCAPKPCHADVLLEIANADD